MLGYCSLLGHRIGVTVCIIMHIMYSISSTHCDHTPSSSCALFSTDLAPLNRAFNPHNTQTLSTDLAPNLPKCAQTTPMRAQNALECPLPQACLRHCLAAHTPLTLLLQHRREQLQHLPVRAAHRDLGAGDVESFDFSGALEEGHGRRLRLAIRAIGSRLRLVLRSLVDH